MDKLVSKKKNELKKLAKKYNLTVLILFGSRNNNTSNKNSDFDFAYFSQKPLKENKFKLWSELETIFKKVDLIELNTTDSIILRYEIFNEGTCIYENKEGIFEDLAGNAWIDYQDNKTYFNEYENILTKAIDEL